MLNLSDVKCPECGHGADEHTVDHKGFCMCNGYLCACCNSQAEILLAALTAATEPRPIETAPKEAKP